MSTDTYCDDCGADINCLACGACPDCDDGCACAWRGEEDEE